MNGLISKPAKNFWFMAVLAVSGSPLFNLPNISVFDVPKGFLNWRDTCIKQDVACHIIGLTNEWVADRFAEGFPCKSHGDISPVNLGFGSVDEEDLGGASIKTRGMVFRGISHETKPSEAQVHWRHALEAKYVDWTGGFRCVRDICVNNGQFD